MAFPTGGAGNRFANRPLLAAALAASLLAAAWPADTREKGPRRNRGVTKDRYLAELGRALEEVGKLQGAATERRRVQMHANLFLAHAALVGAMPVDALTRAVDAFKEAGVAQVDLNMGVTPWADGDKGTIAKYDAVIERIRASGMRVAFNPEYSRRLEKGKTFEAWRRQALEVYGELANRYKPDVFVVVHEPTTMAARMGAKITPAQWAAFARDAAKRVRERSKGSRIGAGGLATERDYFDAFAELKEIDVLTLDVYQLRALPTCEAMIRTARKNGKPVYVEETWRPPYARPRWGMTLEDVSVQGVGDRDFESIDIEWMRTITAWAAANGVEAVTPVWMQTFFAYGGDGTEAFDPQYLREVVDAIKRSKRTRTFRALQELAR
jgi:hypothetical protein